MRASRPRMFGIDAQHIDRSENCLALVGAGEPKYFSIAWCAANEACRRLARDRDRPIRA